MIVSFYFIGFGGWNVHVTVHVTVTVTVTVRICVCVCVCVSVCSSCLAVHHAAVLDAHLC